MNKICLKLSGEHTYRSCHRMTVWINDSVIVIPNGFETDLASIPRLFWNIAAPDDDFIIRPAMLHDFLYQNNCFYSRKNADDIFYQALLDNNVPSYKALFMYYLVRLFGGSHFNKDDCLWARMLETGL